MGIVSRQHAHPSQFRARIDLSVIGAIGRIEPDAECEWYRYGAVGSDAPLEIERSEDMRNSDGGGCVWTRIRQVQAAELLAPSVSKPSLLHQAQEI